MKKTISLATYLWVFAALMGLLVLTVALARLHWAEWNLRGLGIAVTLLIATVKAVLVAVYYQHLKISPPIARAFFFIGIAWLGILFVLTMSDYMTRDWLPNSSGWTLKSGAGGR